MGTFAYREKRLHPVRRSLNAANLRKSPAPHQAMAQSPSRSSPWKRYTRANGGNRNVAPARHHPRVIAKRIPYRKRAAARHRPILAEEGGAKHTPNLPPLGRGRPKQRSARSRSPRMSALPRSASRRTKSSANAQYIPSQSEGLLVDQMAIVIREETKGAAAGGMRAI